MTTTAASTHIPFQLRSPPAFLLRRLLPCPRYSCVSRGTIWSIWTRSGATSELWLKVVNYTRSFNLKRIWSYLLWISYNRSEPGRITFSYRMCDREMEIKIGSPLFSCFWHCFLRFKQDQPLCFVLYVLYVLCIEYSELTTRVSELQLS